MTCYTVVLEQRATASGPWRVAGMDHHESGFTLARFGDSMQVLHAEWISEPNRRVVIHEWASPGDDS